jgi:hypothetical protein
MKQFAGLIGLHEGGGNQWFAVKYPQKLALGWTFDLSLERYRLTKVFFRIKLEYIGFQGFAEFRNVTGGMRNL